MGKVSSNAGLTAMSHKTCVYGSSFGPKMSHKSTPTGLDGGADE
jgi:hypothetical protein